MPFEAFQKQTMPEEIVKAILKMIQSGELRPGDQMPTEHELMTHMNVSRSSVREALRALSIMNVIEIHPGKRTLVTSLEPDLLMEHLEFVISLEDITILHLFEMRKLLEVNCAGLAAQRITESEISEIKSLLTQDAQRDIDVDMHRMIVDIAKNPIIKRVYTSIEQLSRMSRERTGTLEGVREQARRDHPEIIQAIISKDKQAAENAMLRHLTFIETKLREDIEKTEKDQDNTYTEANVKPPNG